MANCGQACPAAVRSGATTTLPVRKQSTHGPWSFCSWNSSSTRAASVEAATRRSSPRGSASSTPAAEASSTCTLRSVSVWRKSMTSKSATMVSASSTKVSDSSSPSISSPPQEGQQGPWRRCRATGGRQVRHRSRSLARVRTQPQTAGDDIAGDVVEPTVLSISIGPQPDKGLGEGDAELFGDHPGGLVDLRPVQRQIRGLPGRPGSRRRGLPVGVLAVEQDNGGDLGQDQRITEFKGAQRTGRVPVEAERPDPDGPDPQRQREVAAALTWRGTA